MLSFRALNLPQCQAKGGPARRAALGPSVLLFSAMPRSFRPFSPPNPCPVVFATWRLVPFPSFSPGVSAMFLAELLRTFILSSQQPLSSNKWIWWLRWDHVCVVEVAGVMWLFPITCHMQAAWHPSHTFLISKTHHFCCGSCDLSCGPAAQITNNVILSNHCMFRSFPTLPTLRDSLCQTFCDF